MCWYAIYIQVHETNYNSFDFDAYLLDTLKTTTPLVSRVLLTWLIEAYQYHGSRGRNKRLTRNIQKMFSILMLYSLLCAQQRGYGKTTWYWVRNRRRDRFVPHAGYVSQLVFILVPLFT